jgi:hypothetical protein
MKVCEHAKVGREAMGENSVAFWNHLGGKREGKECGLRAFASSTKYKLQIIISCQHTDLHHEFLGG